MKKNHKARRTASDGEPEMRAEYDFSGKQGVRGKFFRAYRQGYTVTIRREDGTTETRRFAPEAGAVVLEPDVLKRFPDSKSVNDALRSLMAAKPSKAGGRSTAKKPSRAALQKNLAPPAAKQS